MQNTMSRERTILVTFGIMMGLFLASIEGTVVGTAMPTIIAQLQGIELYGAIAGKKAAAPGIERLLIFHHYHRFFHCVQRGPAALQHSPSCSHRPAYSCQMGFRHVIWNRPSPAVDQQHGMSLDGQDLIVKIKE